jgi:hypothetical protein
MVTAPKLVIVPTPENMTDERRTKFTKTDAADNPIVALTSHNTEQSQRGSNLSSP